MPTIALYLQQLIRYRRLNMEQYRFSGITIQKTTPVLPCHEPTVTEEITDSDRVDSNLNTRKRGAHNVTFLIFSSAYVYTR